MSKQTANRAVPAPLDADAAFVIHLTGADPADPTAASGRAEHVASGRSRRFSSMIELHGFMQSILAGRPGRRPSSTNPTYPTDKGDQ